MRDNNSTSGDHEWSLLVILYYVLTRNTVHCIMIMLFRF